MRVDGVSNRGTGKGFSVGSAAAGQSNCAYLLPRVIATNPEPTAAQTKSVQTFYDHHVTNPHNAVPDLQILLASRFKRYRMEVQIPGTSSPASMAAHARTIVAYDGSSATSHIIRLM
jgi:hypothetical protein